MGPDSAAAACDSVIETTQRQTTLGIPLILSAVSGAAAPDDATAAAAAVALSCTAATTKFLQTTHKLCACTTSICQHCYSEAAFLQSAFWLYVSNTELS